MSAWQAALLGVALGCGYSFVRGFIRGWRNRPAPLDREYRE